MGAKNILYKASNENNLNWSDESMLSLVCDYLNHHGSLEDFKKHVEAVAQEEVDDSDSTD